MKWFFGVTLISVVFSFEDTGSLLAYGYEEKTKPVEIKEEKFIPRYFARVEERKLDNQQEKESIDKFTAENALGNFGITTATAVPPLCGREWILSADILYWHAHLEGTDYAARRTVSTNPTMNSNTTQSLEFLWDFGFRLGVGTIIRDDRWDVDLNYTYFHTSAKDSARSMSASTITPLWSGAIESLSFGSGKSSLSLSYNNVNAEIGRSYFISSLLTLRPNFGARSCWIREIKKSMFLPVTNSDPSLNVKDTSNMWGIGPRAGISGRWYLCNGFHFTSSIGMSFLYSYYQVRHLDTLFATPKELIKVKEKRHRYIPVADLLVGVGWGRYICEQRQYLHFEVGYDLEYLWSQNQFIQVLPRVSDNSREYYTNADRDLSLNGLTVKAQVNF